jgi:DNA-binding NarL/FixJ family response regulator
VDVHGQLRGTMDGGDSLVSGGHQVLRTAGATQHAKRLQRIPVWANDDAQVQAILNLHFPKWRTDATQTTRAAQWAFIITHYFRMGETSARIADSLGKTDKYVRDKVRRIYQAAEGKNAQGKIMGARPRGRPKKNREAIETSM